MTYAFERKHLRLPKGKDRRRALTDEQRADIKTRYKNGEGIRSIARVYEGVCSRRLVQFVIFPDRAALVAQQSKEREQHKVSYSKVRGTKWAKTMREHRSYKHRVLKDKK